MEVGAVSTVIGRAAHRLGVVERASQHFAGRGRFFLLVGIGSVVVDREHIGAAGTGLHHCGFSIKKRDGFEAVPPVLCVS